MSLHLAGLLQERSARKYRAFLKEIEAVHAEQALRFARPDWPDHRWGFGQNGSIAGIVYHVAAWKQLALPALRGDAPRTRQEFDPAHAPAPTDWAGLVVWYRQIGAEWIAQTAPLTDQDFEKSLPWEGHTITLAELVMEIIDHDIQHASQIEYLRQLIAAGA